MKIGRIIYDAVMIVIWLVVLAGTCYCLKTLPAVQNAYVMFLGWLALLLIAFAGVLYNIRQLSNSFADYLEDSIRCNFHYSPEDRCTLTSGHRGYHRKA